MARCSRYSQMLPNATRCCQMLPDAARCSQMLPSGATGRSKLQLEPAQEKTYRLSGTCKNINICRAGATGRLKWLLQRAPDAPRCYQMFPNAPIGRHWALEMAAPACSGTDLAFLFDLQEYCYLPHRSRWALETAAPACSGEHLSF